MASPTTLVTAEQIIAEVRRLAAERPDFIYEKPAGSTFCLYKHGDGPGCIFGQALDNLGIYVDAQMTGTISTVLFNEGITPDWKQAAWMATVQMTQDNWRTWADAIAEADKAYPLV